MTKASSQALHIGKQIHGYFFKIHIHPSKCHKISIEWEFFTSIHTLINQNFHTCSINQNFTWVTTYFACGISSNIWHAQLNLQSFLIYLLHHDGWHYNPTLPASQCHDGRHCKEKKGITRLAEAPATMAQLGGGWSYSPRTASVVVIVEGGGGCGRSQEECVPGRRWPELGGSARRS